MISITQIFGWNVKRKIIFKSILILSLSLFSSFFFHSFLSLLFFRLIFSNLATNYDYDYVCNLHPTINTFMIQVDLQSGTRKTWLNWNYYFFKFNFLYRPIEANDVVIAFYTKQSDSALRNQAKLKNNIIIWNEEFMTR